MAMINRRAALAAIAGVAVAPLANLEGAAIPKAWPDPPTWWAWSTNSVRATMKKIDPRSYFPEVGEMLCCEHPGGKKFVWFDVGERSGYITYNKVRTCDENGRDLSAT